MKISTNTFGTAIDPNNEDRFIFKVGFPISSSRYVAYDLYGLGDVIFM